MTCNLPILIARSRLRAHAMHDDGQLLPSSIDRGNHHLHVAPECQRSPATHERMATVRNQSTRAQTSTSFVSRTVDHIGDLLLQRTSSNDRDEEGQRSRSVRQRWFNSNSSANGSDLEGPARESSSVSAAEKDKKLQASKLGTFDGVGD